MATLKIRVRGLEGASDERALEEALRRRAGVTGASVSCDDACAEVEYEDDELGLDEVLALIEDEGFGATLAG